MLIGIAPGTGTVVADGEIITTATIVDSPTGAKKEEPAVSVAALNRTLTKQTAAKPKRTVSAPTARPAASPQTATDGKTEIASETETGTATANGTVSANVIATGTANAAPVPSATTSVNVETAKTSANDSTALAGTRAAAEMSWTTAATHGALPATASVDADATVTRRAWLVGLRNGIGVTLAVSGNGVEVPGGTEAVGRGVLQVLPVVLLVLQLKRRRGRKRRLFILGAKRERLRRKSRFFHLHCIYLFTPGLVS